MKSNEYKKQGEIQEANSILRKKEIFKNPIRSEEQKELDIAELDLMVRKYSYMAIKYFINNNDYYSAERVIKTMDYFKYRNSIRSKDRLEPTGQINGIMFIGINPSEKSGLTNAWNDPFGQYFGKMLEEAGIDKSKVWMTNLYKKKTPQNRVLSEKEVQEGLEELRMEIFHVHPKIIVTLGKQPADVIKDDTSGFTVMNLPHPAYIMRNNTPEVRSKYLLELKELKKYE